MFGRAVVAATVFAAGALVTHLAHGDRVLLAMPAPASAPRITVQVPTSPPPTVNIQLPAPPPPPPAPAPPMPRPRALTPTIYPECVLSTTQSNPRCSWDPGFPAISADGSRIVRQGDLDDGGRGYPSLTIEFIDTASSKLVRTDIVLRPEEVVDLDHPPEGLLGTMYLRANAIQRVLDAGHYRSMVPLGSNHESPPPMQSKLHAEFDGGNVRIIDDEHNTVPFQHSFGLAGPSRHHSEDEMCGGWGLYSISLAWDPTTGYALATELYHTGGCMCPSTTGTEVVRFR